MAASQPATGRTSRSVATVALVAAVVLGSCSTSGDNGGIPIPPDATDCGTDIQTGDNDNWDYTASTCAHDVTASGGTAYMTATFEDQSGGEGTGTLVFFPDGRLHRLARDASDVTIVDETCARVEWTSTDQGQFAFNAFDCIPR